MNSAASSQATADGECASSSHPHRPSVTRQLNRATTAASVVPVRATQVNDKHTVKATGGATTAHRREATSSAWPRSRASADPSDEHGKRPCHRAVPASSQPAGTAASGRAYC